MVNPTPRLLAAVMAMATAGCAEMVAEAQADAMRPPVPAGALALLGLRTVTGGFLSPVTPALGRQARPGTGMYVRFQSPGPLAMAGQELVVADPGAGRVWRADLGFNTLTPIENARITPGMSLLMGPDYSVWVLDSLAGRVVRFAHGNQPLQVTPAVGDPGQRHFTVAEPGPIALADGGATLLMADKALAQWVELRGDGRLPLPVRPHHADGSTLQSVAAIATWRDEIYVLDAATGAVHRVERDGTVVDTLPGPLEQPAAIVVDRDRRVYVLDALGRSVTVLRRGAEPRVLSAGALGVQQIGGIAVDGDQLALSDRVAGQVVIHRIGTEGRP